MPRIECERVLPFLFIAWMHTDLGERKYLSRGLTAAQATDRCLRKVC